jgi:membrane-associated phospholipid phosphatase
MTNKTKRYLTGLLVVVILSAVNAAVLNNSEIVNIPLLFGGVIIFQLLLTVLIIFFLIVVLRMPLRIVLSILVSAFRGIERNRYIKKAGRRYPFIIPWLKRRFSLHHPTGVLLTSGVIIIVIFLVSFISVAQAVIVHSTYAGFDQRVVNLMPYIRTSSQDTFYSFFTFIASPVLVISFIAIVGIISLFRRQYWLPIILVAAAGGESVILEILKFTIRRPRPDVALRLLVESNFSFPSGHALTATVVYGLVAYILFRFTKAYVGKLLIVIGALVLVGLVAVSRVYFAVHYPTDVFASLLVGGVILSIFITAIEINQRYMIVKKAVLTAALKKTLAFALLITFVAGILLFGYFTHLKTNTSHPTSVALSSLNETAVARLPLYSETLTGVRAEPISLIFIATSDQLKATFMRAGWYVADSSTLNNTFHAFLSAAKNEQYLTAPVTPAYLNFQPETIAFEKPTHTNSLRQRHHTRLWKTNFNVAGIPVWAATASLDQGIGIGSKVALPTHHIDPNIDAERNYISQSLDQSNTSLLRVAEPQDGHNASGDIFFTDGQAVVIQLAQI